MHTEPDGDGPYAENASTNADTSDAKANGSVGSADEPPASPREAAAIRRVRTVGRVLDEAVRVPGTNFRVGLDPILGVVPVGGDAIATIVALYPVAEAVRFVGGDAIATIVALYPVAEAVRFGLPRRTVARMLLRVAVDGVIGSIPVLGTVFDAFWKANEWNARTLERRLREA